MKKIYLFTLVLLIPLFCFGQKNKVSQDENLAKKLVETYFDELWSDFKTSKVKDVCTKDFIFINYSQVWNTDSLTKYQKRTSDEILKLKSKNKIEIITFEKLKNTLYFSYHKHGTWTENGKIVETLHNLQSAVAVKTKGGWKLEMIHSTTVSSKTYRPLDAWDYTLMSLSAKTAEYTIFDRVEGTNAAEAELITYKLGEDKITIKYKKTGCDIEIFNKGISKKIVGRDFNPDSFLEYVEFHTAYRIKSEKDSLIVIEYRPQGAQYGAFFFVIDNEYNTYFLITDKGRITCFSDLDGDGDIDFLDIDATLAYTEQIFENNHTEVFHFKLIELENGEKINKNPKYANLAMMSCEENYIITTKDEVDKLEVDPCGEENENVRKKIEKELSSVLIEKE